MLSLKQNNREAKKIPDLNSWNLYLHAFL